MKKSAKAKKPTKAKKAAKAKVSPYYAQSKRLGFRLITAKDQTLYCDLFTDAKTLEHVCPPLSQQKAVESFKKAVSVSAVLPLKQRISVIVEKSTKKPIGIASIKMTDAERCRAEGGILLKPTAFAQRFAIESSLALIDAAFKRHTISELTAQVASAHKAGVKLVNGSGYTLREALPQVAGLAPRNLWSISRDQWANTSK
jgi:RimJ/RimL family protein N-acetyltransferase